MRGVEKTESKRRGYGKLVLVVKSSCLDVRPKRAIAAAVSDDRSLARGVR